jgi:hypothetical protein
MKDVYVDKFSSLIQETSGRTGTYLPPTIEIYLTYLLASHVERTDFFKDPVALRYMQLSSHHSAKDLGDNCLVIAGIFSGLRGMDDSYYVNIGRGSYHTAAIATGSEILDRLARDFVEYKQFLNQITPPRYF